MKWTEVTRHRTAQSCWTVIDGQVYDVTEFLSHHPGGPMTLLDYAGKDASVAFHNVHSVEVLHQLAEDKRLGCVQGENTMDNNTSPNSPTLPDALYLSSDVMAPSTTVEEEIKQTLIKPSNTNSTKSLLRLEECVILDDFHLAAKSKLSERAYIYISSSSLRRSGPPPSVLQERLQPWAHISFRPRVLRDVSRVSMSSSMLSQPSRYPFFIAAMGVVGTCHPDGELLFARACAKLGLHYCVSTGSTRPVEQIVECYYSSVEKTQGGGGRKSVGAVSEQSGNMFFQLYVHSDIEISKRLLRKLRGLGCFKGLMVTVDTPLVGKRFEDRRLIARERLAAGLASPPQGSTSTNGGGGGGGGQGGELSEGGRAKPGVLSQTLSWDDLKWIRDEWSGPIVIKGVQSAEDAWIAAQMGVQGVYLSNHGSRQLTDAPSSLDTLLEIRNAYPEIFKRVEVYVDGFFSTGADIVKALCLGATAVGIGRPFLYAGVAYDDAGIAKAVEILSEEIESTMKFLGVTEISQLKPEFLRLKASQL